MGNRVDNPFQYFTDSSGLALDSGYIYIGNQNLNPETSPIQVYWDEALTIPAAQPIRTVSGYPSRNGSAAQLYVAQTDFSITVRDRNRRLVFSALSSQGLSTFESDLSGPNGSSMVGWTRAELSDQINKVNQALDSQVVSIWEFEHLIVSKPNPADPQTWDWGPAFQGAVDFSLTVRTRPTTGVGVAYLSTEIHFPHGLYPIRTPVVAIKQSTTANASDTQSLVISGEGSMASILRPDAAGLTMFRAESLRLEVRDIGVFSSTVEAVAATIKAFKLGNENTLASFCQRCHFENVSIIRVHKGIEIGILHDSYFSNVYIGNLLGGTSTDHAVGIDVLPNAEDNSNLLTFDQLHIEPADSEFCDLMRVTGRTGAAGLHQNFTFINPHFETRRYDATCLNLLGLVNSNIYDPVFTRNTNTGVPGYLSSVQAVIVDTLCSNINFHGGVVHHSGTAASDMPKLIRYEGSARHIRWFGTRINAAKAAGPFGLADIVINNSTDTTMETLQFERVIIMDQFNIPYSTDLQFNSPAQYTRRYRWQVETATAAGVFQYTTSTDGSSPSTLMRIAPEQISMTGHRAPAFTSTIADTATITFSAPTTGGNASRRGKYSIIGYGNVAGGIVEFHSTGTVLTATFTGALFAIGNTDPGTAGKLNVFLSGTSISITNRTGNPQTIGIEFTGLL